MQLNIKTEEAYALAKEIAELKGVSLTTAVTEALRRERDTLRNNVRKKPSVEDILALAREAGRGWKDDTDHGDLLYDEYGAPK